MEVWNLDYAPEKLAGTVLRYEHSAGVDYTSSSVLSYLFLQRYRHGYRNPSWRAQVTNLQDATTPLVARNYRIKCSLSSIETSGYLPTYSADSRGLYLLRCPEVSLISPSYSMPTAALYNRVLGRLYDRAHEYLTKVNGGTILGEIRETIHGIRHPLTGIRELLLKHNTRILKAMTPSYRRKVSRRTVLSAAADSWLEVVFGMTPLVADISDSFRYLSQLSSKSLDVTWLEASEVEVSSSTPSLVWNAGLHLGLNLRSSGVIRNKTLVRMRALIDTSMKPTGVLSDIGLVPREFIPTVWELIPYSWVVDYFSNVSSVLNAVSFPKSAIKFVVITQRGSTHQEFTTMPSLTPGIRTSVTVPSRTTFDYSQINRSSITGSKLPLPHVDVLVHASLRRLLNLTAVEVQLRHSSRRLSTLPLK